MAWYGDKKIDDTLTFTAATSNPSTGAAADVDSSGAPAYRVYEDETGTAILTGSMAKLDDANTLGLYSEQITLSAANGFENGKSYTIYLSATVNSVAGNAMHNFSVGVQPSAAAIRSEIDSNSTQLAAIVADTNELQSDDYPTTLTAIQSALTTIDGIVDAVLVDTGTTLDGKIDVIDGLVDAIKAKTDDLTFTVSNQLDANIQSINDTTITGDGGSGTEFDVA